MVQARTGPCAGVFCTIPVPTDWPEQDVKVVDEKISDSVGRVRYRNLDGQIRQMILTIPRLNAGRHAEALITLAVTRRRLEFPAPAELVIPPKVPRKISKYLGASPSIECRNARIRGKANEILNAHDGGWAKVEALQTWVREHIEDRNEQLKGAAEVLRDGHGSHEDITGLFIALCRAGKIPARTVWVPRSCYAEFYLEDKDGKGYWIPCELREKSVFGQVAELLPILQKGDAIKVPEKKEPQRYVAEYLKGKTGRGLGRPTVRFVRELLPPE